MTENRIYAGLIKGRHQMPCEEYIFSGAIEDVHNYGVIRRHIMDWCVDHSIVPSLVNGAAVNGAAVNGAEDSLVYRCEGVRLCVYVTGLTSVTVELVKAYMLNGISLTLLNYDSVSGEYREQFVL